MNSLVVITTILYVLVVGEFLFNLFSVFSQARKLKAEGKTPLMSKNLLVVAVVAMVEGLMVWFCTYLVNLLHLNQTTIDYVVVVFIILYLVKQSVAYLTAWGVWAVFVSIESKRMKNKIDEEREGVF